jgi:hypothetical protein
MAKKFVPIPLSVEEGKTRYPRVRKKTAREAALEVVERLLSVEAQWLDDVEQLRSSARRRARHAEPDPDCIPAYWDPP